MSYGLLSVRSSNTFGNDLKSGGETSIVKVLGSNLMRLDNLLGVQGVPRHDQILAKAAKLGTGS